MKVKDLIKALQELPEDQQELEFQVCGADSPECELVSPVGLYPQPELRRQSSGPSMNASYVKTGKIAYITIESY